MTKFASKLYHAVPKASQEPRSDELPETNGRALYGGTNYHDTAPDEYGFSSSQHIAEPDRRYSTKEATQRVPADGNPLHVGGLSFGPAIGRFVDVYFWKGFQEDR